MTTDMMDSDIQQTPFVKQLAANDRPTRDSALHSLRTYLSASSRTFTPLSLLKLHKGLFYCMWMADRPIPQQRLASSLADLVLLLPSSNVVPYLRAFWQTMAREWTGIDVLRMEKFLLLVRRMVGVMLAVVRREDWEKDLVGEVVGVLAEEGAPFYVGTGDGKVPMGLRFHVLDVWVDEIERAGVEDVGLGEEGEEEEDEEEEERETKKERLEWLLKPVRKLAKESPTKAVRLRAREVLADTRLPENKRQLQDGEAEGEEQEDDGSPPIKKRKVVVDERHDEREEKEDEGENDGWDGIED